MNKIIYLIFFAFSTIFSKDEKVKNIKKENWITIFVHGCVGLRSNFNYKTFKRLLKDKIEGTQYQKNVIETRQKPFLYTLQPMQECGLVPVHEGKNYPSAAYFLSNLLDSQYHFWEHQEINKYYTYGWSGLLSNKQRECESRTFYKDLKNEIIRLRKNGLKPKIRIISYSHGALLSFNLAKIRRCFYPKDKFKIDQLITLGMPVHNTTYELIDKNMFKEIFHIYSKSDYVQRLDIFGPCHFFSQKRFFGCLPDNITQIELRITARPLLIPKKCVPIHMRRSTDQSPGHIEMWFFGWAPKGYRKNFVMYPLPSSILVPYLIKVAREHKKYSHNLKIDIRPDEEIAIIKSRDSRFCDIIPFMNIHDFVKLKWDACIFHPGQEEFVREYIKLQGNINPADYK